MIDQLNALLSGDNGKKTLNVNCGAAIVLEIRDEFLENYDSVMINCGSFFGSNKAYAALMAKGAKVNSGRSVIREINGEIVHLSGGTNITDDMDFSGKYVICEGNLIVKGDGGQAFANADGVHVTGALYYPEGRGAAFLSKVAGRSIAYPQDAQLVIDDVKFGEMLQSVMEGTAHVWVHGEIEAMDESALARAVEKGLKFTCKTLFTMESLNEKYGGMFHAEEYILVPDGHEVAPGITLRAGEAELYGPCIFVKGDLLLNKKDTACLGELKSIIVTGKATLPAACAKSFRAIGKAAEYEIMPNDADLIVEVNGFQIIGHDYLQTLIGKNETIALNVRGALLFSEDVSAGDIDAIGSLALDGAVIMPDAAQGALAQKARVINGALLTIETLKSMTGLSLPEILAKIQSSLGNTNTAYINTGTYILA